MNDYTIEPIAAERNEEKIRGTLYLPKGKGPFPCIIVCNGFYESQEDWEMLAKAAVKKEIAAVTFDFMGGSLDSKSDGLVFEMSIKTELSDLEQIIETVKEMPKISHIFLVGADQGGFVAAMAAAQYPKDIYAMVLYYPSFNLPDRIRTLYKSRKEFPSASRLQGFPVGEIYYQDLYGLDFAEEIAGYPKPVLILHGLEDEEVPIKYSKEAIVQYNHGQFVELPEVGHSFPPDVMKKDVIPITLKFIEIANTFEDLLEEHKKARKIEDKEDDLEDNYED